MNNPNDIYNLLSIESGITDLSAVKQLYHALSRVFYKELRTTGSIILPGIGTFTVRTVGATGKHIFQGRVIPPYKMLRYAPDRTLREQITHL
jgi:nucleoid DNA-binding protein